jgi:Rps23 Pro-64 3,4-dihydroxylase Tpa1-like proline 4-hydroxylase
MPKPLFALNPDLPRDELATEFARSGRLQIRDVLTRETAEELRDILANRTEWGVAIQAGAKDKPFSLRGREMQKPAPAQEVTERVKATDRAAASRDYAFRHMRYSLVEGYLEKWNPGGPHDLLLEHLNAPEFMGLMRAVTGMPDLVKADGHASCYARQHFLGKHLDSHVAEGWRVAYVLNLTIDDWYPDWGGYLVFYDDDGDIETGFMPRFNSLNLFRVPQAHAVTYVPPFAPRGRYAISGWLRDR